ncbi:Replication protein 15 [Burkholderia pseudomallei]|nr:Replication protein 15 [Burkholderia pseudomallei]
MKVKAKENEPSRTPFGMLETRVWTDEKFVKLSPIPPSGQGLWLYLLLGPHTAQTRVVPGVCLVSRAALAEALHWNIDEFDEKFAEIFGRKMAVADWEHQILWLPNALKRHMPRSPHNVLAWRAGWELIPDCPLKRRIYRAMKAAISGRGPAFEKAFDEAIKPAAHGSAGIKAPRAARGPSSRTRSDHKSKDGPAADAEKSGPSSRRRSDHKPKDGGTMNAKKVSPIDVDVDKDKDVNPTTNPKGVNGATAPLTPRARAREREAASDPAQAPPDKARSEFASVRRFVAANSQRDLLDDEIGEALPDKALRDDGRTIPANMVEPSAPKRSRGKTREAAPAKARGPDTGPTWAAYSEAFVARYGVEPVRNAIVNSQMLHFVERVGVAEAPEIARFFVRHGNGYYVRRSHAVGLLLQDAESLRTQWATQRPVTATEAAMADRTATNANAFAPLIAEARERERREAKHGN